MPPLGAFLGAVIAGIAASAAAVTGVVAGFGGLAAFLSSPIGSLILAAGLSLVSTLFMRKSQQSPNIEASKVNVRIPEGERWLSGGITRNGGSIVFAEYDNEGNFWFVVIHADSIMTERAAVYFDDTTVTIDAENWVTTNAFCLDSDGDPIEDDVILDPPSKVRCFRIWTRTYTETDPVPPPVTELIAAFPGDGGWTLDHKLVGTTYSVVFMKRINSKHRYKVYKWRGSIGIGEPAISVVGKWSNVYNPNDNTQTNGVPTTYKFSRNPVLLWAWFRTHRYGRNKPRTAINWERVAEQALICDQIVKDLNLVDHVRYQCGVSVPESKERHLGELEIMMSCDGQLVFDHDGKVWLRVGHYTAPTLHLSRNRDIIAMESVEAQNGESETNGVIVRYIDPEANYVTNPSAPWVNPRYYVPGETPKYMVVDILSCNDHNQAMRLAKAIGLRSQPEYKILPTCGLRGLRARHERFFNLTYDNTFAGDHEIVTPVEIDGVGFFAGFGAVPVDPNRWTLLPGEEKPKPVFKDVEIDRTGLTLASGVIISYVNHRFEIHFTTPTREDYTYEFQYRAVGAVDWLNMTVDMDRSFAYSGIVPQNKTYEFQWRTRTPGGFVSPFSAPPVPAAATVLNVTATGQTTTGQVSVAFVPFRVSVGTKYADNANRADGAIGGFWTKYGSGTSTFVILANEFSYGGGTGNVFFGAPSLATPNHWAQVLTRVIPSTSQYLVAVRAQNDTNWIGLRYNSGWQLYKRVAGTVTQIGSTVASPAWAANQIIRIEVVGTSCKVWINNTKIMDVTLTSDLATNTITGTVAGGTAGGKTDNFETGVFPGTPPYLFADIYNRLPPGIVVNAATGVVSGTPTTAGTYPEIIIRVQDSDANYIDLPSFSIVINP